MKGVGLAQGHTHQPPGLTTQGCRLSQAASVTLSDALGLGADLQPKWRQSSQGDGGPESHSHCSKAAQHAGKIPS